MSDIIHWLVSIAEGFGGYLGIFVVSILGNLIPFIPIPYLVAVYLYTAYMPGSHPLIVGIVSGFGGGVGKLIVFALTRGAALLISQEKREEFEALRELIGNYGALAVFIFAVTPSPDDVVIAILGLMKYDLLKFFVSVTAGKIVISVITAYTGKTVTQLLGPERFWESLVISIAIFIVAMILMSIINWEKVIRIVGKNGWKELYRKIRKEGFRKTLLH